MANKLWSAVQKGTYSGATAYTVGDFVVYNGSSYTCILNSTGNLPTNATYFALVVSKGDTGATGATGDTGATGPAGPTGPAGEVTTANSPAANEFARFTGATTIEGRTVAETKTDLSLNNLDNTSDANKPVSTAQQTALDLKANLASPTFTGAVGLAENASIALDPAGSADGKYTGITIAGTAGTTLAFGDLCYLAVADSRWELADADAAATGAAVLGMCVLAAAADGNATTMLLYGTCRADAKFPALTIGAAVYVGETAGAIQVAIPTGADNVIRVVGHALTADEILFNPSQDHQISVA